MNHSSFKNKNNRTMQRSLLLALSLITSLNIINGYLHSASSVNRGVLASALEKRDHCRENNCTINQGSGCDIGCHACWPFSEKPYDGSERRELCLADGCNDNNACVFELKYNIHKCYNCAKNLRKLCQKYKTCDTLTRDCSICSRLNDLPSTLVYAEKSQIFPEHKILSANKNISLPILNVRTNIKESVEKGNVNKQIGINDDLDLVIHEDTIMTVAVLVIIIMTLISTLVYKARLQINRLVLSVWSKSRFSVLSSISSLETAMTAVIPSEV